MLLILAIVVLVAAVIVYIVMKATEKAPPPNPAEIETGPKVVYEATVGAIKFTFQEARDMGSILRGSLSRNPNWQKDIVTTERYIKVAIGAQNKGKQNIEDRTWNLGNIIDSEGRIFVPEEDYTIDAWLPQPDLCGALLKPEFAPTACAKIYEVAKISQGLKVEVKAGQKNASGEYSTDERSMQTALIDLIVN